MENNNVSVQRINKRPYLKPDVFEQIRTCPMCAVNERMVFWRNVKAKPEYQFEFSVCRCCGYTVILERFIVFSKTKIDLTRPDINGYLHDLTSGARAAAANFIQKETVKKAISINNLRYITIDEEEKIYRDAEDKRERARIEQRLKDEAAARNDIVVVDSNVTRANGIPRKLVVARIVKEEERKNSQQKANFVCKFCGKKFVTKSKLHNHKCDNESRESYVARAKRLNEMRTSIRDRIKEVGSNSSMN